MKILKYISVFILTATLLTSCYEDYVNDFDVTTAYFGSQKPLRTIVANGDMSFEVGVALGGMREDDGSYEVSFEVDTNLLNMIPSASKFKPLPEAYYTLGDASKFNIIKDHMRVVKVTLDQAAFTADADALDETYAIAMRITDANVDSIPGGDLDTATIDSEDITILVVKYISQYSGTYYSKGVQYEMDASGNYIDTLTYSKSALSQNDDIYLETLGANKVETERIGGNIPGGLQLTINTDGSVSVASDDVTVESATVTYSAAETTFTIDATVEWFGIKYKVEDQLILRQNPELDLRFEEW